MRPEDVGKWLERANPVPPDEEKAWAKSEGGRAVFARVLEHSLAAPSPQRSQRARFVIVTCLVFVFLAGLGLWTVTRDRTVKTPPTRVASNPTTLATRTTTTDQDILSVNGDPLLSAVVHARLLVSGEVLATDTTPAADSLGLELRVERVWRGQASAGMTLHVLIPTSMLFPPELYHPLPNAQAEARELKRLAGLTLVAFVQYPTADSGRSDVRLRGESFVYVLANGELVRAGFFLARQRDPEAQTFSSLEAAVAKAGPAN